MSFSFRPILSQKSLVGMRLCNSINWNSISLVVFVQHTLQHKIGKFRVKCSFFV